MEALRMPKLHAIDEYEVIRIHKKVGDIAKKGEHFLDARLEDESERQVCFYVNGKIIEINVKPGSIVREDSLLGVVDDEFSC